MKRIVLLTGFIMSLLLTSNTLVAQNTDNPIEAFAQVKGLIKTDPTRAEVEINQLLKGKNKKNAELLTAIGRAYLDAKNVAKAATYAQSAQKANSKYSEAYVLKGDIALAEKNIGEACQYYEQAIYFDSNNKQAYLKYANAYKNANPQLAIEKLKELITIDPTLMQAYEELADVYYGNNQFDKAAEVYAQFINMPGVTEKDFTRYAFALFLNHEFDKSLNVVLKGLEKNPRNATFNRLAMYNYADLKRYEEGLAAADNLFNKSDDPNFAYLDYVYHGHLLGTVKRYDEAIAEYKKAMSTDDQKENLWREISELYESKGDYGQAIESYRKYYDALPEDKQTPDLELTLGKLYYSKGLSTDSINYPYTEEEKRSALREADKLFGSIAIRVPDNYLGLLWQARANSGLDPETTEGMAKPYYEKVIEMLVAKGDSRYNSVLIEAYSYMGYYYLVANKLPESIEYWNKILSIDPQNSTAQRALEGIKG